MRRRATAIAALLAAVAVLAVAPFVSGYDSCLHYRSLCLRNSTCHRHLQSFQQSCGFSLASCTGNSPSDCVYFIREIRQLFPTSSCTCYDAHGFSQECDYFRQIVWNHPCERRLKDTGEDMKLAHSSLHATRSHSYGRRTTRTPIADRIQQLKTQLSGELETRSSLQTKTCDAALNDVCLRHVSCSQLWRLFRASCDVDQDNRCRMVDREVCWQSFEGLSWTGLGDCKCASSNSSDCHWIRLHTNYNKCIYEISKSGQFPALVPLSESRNEALLGYRNRYEQHNFSEQRPTTPNPAISWTNIPATQPTTTRTTSTTTTSSTTTTTPPTTAAPWWNAPTRITIRYAQQDWAYGGESSASHRTTFQNELKLNARIEDGRRQEFAASFIPRRTANRSSCQDAIRRCEAVDECRWHLGELRVRCAPTTCRRDECSSALQRFSTYVPFALVESVMFCHCAAGDAACLEQQELFYPKCLYRSSSVLSTCTQATAKCDADSRCRHIRHALNAHCTIVNGECAQNSLDACRRTILSARASVLEQPCFCALSDVNCLAHQKMMIPNNPCIEQAMVEYSRIMGYNSAQRDASLETNRIASTDAVREDVQKTNWGTDALPQQTPPPSTTSSTSMPPPVPTPRASPRSISRDNEKPSAGGSNRQHRPRNRSRTTTPRPKLLTSTTTPKTTTTSTTTTTTTTAAMTTVSTVDGPMKKFAQDVAEQEEEHEREDQDEEEQMDQEELSEEAEVDEQKVEKELLVVEKPNMSGKKLKFRTTMSPPKSSEPPPPWVSTTTEAPTTTTVFTTHAPPPPDGCHTKDSSGRDIFAHQGSIIRRYVDWSSRCSTWCDCEDIDHLVCESLPCLEHKNCDAPLTTLEFGERIYMKGRGACFCETGNFICELPEELPETYPGLYLSIGYSQEDVAMLRKSVPREILDRAGFVSTNAATDIGSRLQITFERILPTDLRCRIVTMPEMDEPGNAFFRVEWYGMNELLNHTKVQWHSGGAEKICSPYVFKLADHFSLNESPRFQLVLSTVKQVKVLDYLNGLPLKSSNLPSFFSFWLYISLLILSMR